jgi:hypothetical protein
VRNHQTQPVTLSESFNGANTSDFAITGGSCTTTLAPNTSCTLSVTFTASALGTESATLSITDSPDPLGPYAVALTTAPTIPATVSPSKMSYGTLKTASKTKNVTITNLSSVALPLSESFSGANGNDFAVTGGTCGATAAGNSSCTIAVTFTPTGGGSAESASMAVSIDSDPNSPHSISLTGTGPWSENRSGGGLLAAHAEAAAGESVAGVFVDHHRANFIARFSVDKNHRRAAFAPEPVAAPSPHRGEHVPECAALVGQAVFEARRTLFVGDLL